MNAALLGAFIDDFSTKITQKTVIVIDNAFFTMQILSIIKPKNGNKKTFTSGFYLSIAASAVRPHLNIIEILWQKVKYEWLKPHHYFDWQSLNNALDEIFINMDSKYTINFT